MEPGTIIAAKRAAGAPGATTSGIPRSSWYFKKSQEDLGIPMSDARNQYLAYHEGRTGYLRGSHRHKGWLLRISDEVADRALLYDLQLRSCGMV